MRFVSQYLMIVVVVFYVFFWGSCLCSSYFSTSDNTQIRADSKLLFVVGDDKVGCHWKCIITNCHFEESICVDTPSCPANAYFYPSPIGASCHTAEGNCKTTTQTVKGAVCTFTGSTNAILCSGNKKRCAITKVFSAGDHIASTVKDPNNHQNVDDLRTFKDVIVDQEESTHCPNDPTDDPTKLGCN